MSDFVTVFAGEPQPARAISVSLPTLYWRVWPDVASVELTLNGKALPASYNRARLAVIARPERPLPPGSYRVRCQVRFHGGGVSTRDWSFTVLPGALVALDATPSGPQSALLGAVNRLRRRVGLSPLAFDPALAAAASSHAAYLRRHHQSGHLQSPRLSGFIGANPAERARRFGFVEEILVEDVAVQSGGSPSRGGRILSAVSGLFDAPYHRLPFLNPLLTTLGAAFEEGRRADSYAVLLFGGADAPGRPGRTIVSPASDQEGVPRLWSNNETPDPLRLHEGLTPPVGYPIVFSHHPARVSGRPAAPLRFDGARLIGPDGRAVPLVVNHPGNDPELGGQALVLIPREPLLPGKTYRASVRARDGQGRDLSRSWTFTTAL